MLRTKLASLSPKIVIEEKINNPNRLKWFYRMLYLYWFTISVRFYNDSTERKFQYNLVIKLFHANLNSQHDSMICLALASFPIFAICIHYGWNDFIWKNSTIRNFFRHLLELERSFKVSENKFEKSMVKNNPIISIMKPETALIQIIFIRKSIKFTHYFSAFFCKFSFFALNRLAIMRVTLSKWELLIK